MARHSGFALVELMIASAIALGLLAGAVRFYGEFAVKQASAHNDMALADALLKLKMMLIEIRAHSLSNCMSGPSPYIEARGGVIALTRLNDNAAALPLANDNTDVHWFVSDDCKVDISAVTTPTSATSAVNAFRIDQYQLTNRYSHDCRALYLKRPGFRAEAWLPNIWVNLHNSQLTVSYGCRTTESTSYIDIPSEGS